MCNSEDEKERVREREKSFFLLIPEIILFLSFGAMERVMRLKKSTVRTLLLLVVPNHPVMRQLMMNRVIWSQCKNG